MILGLGYSLQFLCLIIFSKNAFTIGYYCILRQHSIQSEIQCPMQWMILVSTPVQRSSISPDARRDWAVTSLDMNPNDGLIYFTPVVIVIMILEGITLSQRLSCQNLQGGILGCVSYLCRCVMQRTMDSLGHMRLVPAQDLHFFYTLSHLSALQNCALLFSTIFSLFSYLKCA